MKGRESGMPEEAYWGSFFDAEAALEKLLAYVQQKAIHLGITNVRSEVRDFVAQGTGLANASQSHAMIFNLLHLEQPVALLREAHRVLKPSGTISVMHWRSDIPTPRAPSLEIRPRPDQCAAWMEEAGFLDVEPVDLQDCCRYHFALVAKR